MKVLLVSLLVILSGNLVGQELLEDGKCIIYNGEKYCGEEEMETLFSLNDQSLFWYKESIASNDRASNFGVLSIVGLGASYFLLKNAEGGNSPDYGPLTLGLGVGIIACVFGIVGIASKNRASEERQIAIDLFNDGPLGVIKPKHNYEYNFTVDESRIGIVVSF